MPSLHHLLIRALDGRTSEAEALVAIRFARREAQGKDVYQLLQTLQGNEPHRSPRRRLSWEHEINLTNIHCSYFVALQEAIYLVADELGISDCRIELTRHQDNKTIHAGFRIRFNGDTALARRFDASITELLDAINHQRRAEAQRGRRRMSAWEQAVEAMAPREEPQPPKKGIFSWF